MPPSHPPPAAPSKTQVFFRRSASTGALWLLAGLAFASMRAWAYLGLLAVLTLAGTAEYFRMAAAAGLRAHGRFVLLLATAYCGVLYAGLLGCPAPLPHWELAAVAVALCGAFALQLRHPVEDMRPLTEVAVAFAGFVYVPVLFNFMAMLLVFDPSWLRPGGMVKPDAAFLLLWLVAVTKFSDMGAYITGSLIGRHKMIPHISPGKTWEGFAGGLAFSQLAGCGLFACFPAHYSVLGGWGHVVLLSLVLAVLAVIGDLAESVVKRALGAKDSGRFLPGIGGALDLIDSLCFTAPALYFYLAWMHPSA